MLWNKEYLHIKINKILLMQLILPQVDTINRINKDFLVRIKQYPLIKINNKYNKLINKH
jgi:hypothetical protein